MYTRGTYYLSVRSKSSVNFFDVFWQLIWLLVCDDGICILILLIIY